jgi:hypothetical protein
MDLIIITLAGMAVTAGLVIAGGAGRSDDEARIPVKVRKRRRGPR